MLAATSCAARFPTPWPAEALAAEVNAPGRALVHYLRQAEADVEVCSLGRQGPHAPVVDEAVLALLHDALLDETVAPEVWRGCLLHLWSGLPEEGQQALALTLLLELHRFTRTGAVDDRRVGIPMFVAMLDALVGRPEGLLLPADRVRSVSGDLRDAMGAERLRCPQHLPRHSPPAGYRARQRGCGGGRSSTRPCWPGCPMRTRCTRWLGVFPMPRCWSWPARDSCACGWLASTTRHWHPSPMRSWRGCSGTVTGSRRPSASGSVGLRVNPQAAGHEEEKDHGPAGVPGASRPGGARLGRANGGTVTPVARARARKEFP